MSRIELSRSGSRRRASGRVLPGLIALLLLIAAVTAGWTWLTLAWAYSEGERAGVLQKFSRKGWLCKSQEGELAQYIVTSMAPQIWEFSVRDEPVALQLRKAVGHKVQLHYTEHPGIPSSCFGETRYFVDGLVVTDDIPAPTVPTPLVPASPPAAVPAPPPASAAAQ